VDVVSGGAKLRFEGIVEAPGVAGALVPVKNPETGKIVHARVDREGHARLTLSATEN
jgi:flagella basal body P-ring formation protein FlgA